MCAWMRDCLSCSQDKTNGSFYPLSSSSSQMEVAEGRQAAVVDNFTARFHAECLSQSFAVHCVRSAHILTPSLFRCFIDRLARHTFQTRWMQVGWKRPWGKCGATTSFYLETTSNCNEQLGIFRMWHIKNTLPFKSLGVRMFRRHLLYVTKICYFK